MDLCCARWVDGKTCHQIRGRTWFDAPHHVRLKVIIGSAHPLSTPSSSTTLTLVVSPGQNEIEQMKKHGLDIMPRRQRLNESQPSLDETSKDSNESLRPVFLCATWLTGFDAPSYSSSNFSAR